MVSCAVAAAQQPRSQVVPPNTYVVRAGLPPASQARRRQHRYELPFAIPTCSPEGVRSAASPTTKQPNRRNAQCAFKPCDN